MRRLRSHANLGSLWSIGEALTERVLGSILARFFNIFNKVILSVFVSLDPGLLKKVPDTTSALNRSTDAALC